MNIIVGWHVANSILKKSFDDKIYITPQKLYSLVYLLYSEFLYINYKSLFHEVFKKTRLGPLVPSVYFKFSCYKNKVIRTYAKDATDKTFIINGQNFNECLSIIWEKFKNYSDEELLRIIVEGKNYCSNSNEILTDNDIFYDCIDRRINETKKVKIYKKDN